MLKSSSADSNNRRRVMRTNKKHKTFHLRERTATTKKNKAWSQFSRWDGELSDGESDFVDFCRANGLARPSPAPTQRMSHSIRKDVERSSNKVLSASRSVDKDSKYISSLCSFLKDKLEFFLESNYQSVEVFNQEEDCDKHNDELSNDTDEHDSSMAVVSISDKKSTESISSNSLLSSSKSETIRRWSNSILNRNSDKANNHTFPIIQLRKEVMPVMQCRSPDDQITAEEKDSTHYSGVKFRHVLFQRPGREWEANVETDIMKLYEQAEAKPSSIIQVQGQIETMENKRNHTPSYVLALANLFRRRMKIRKEYCQELSDMADTSVNGAAIKPQHCNDCSSLSSIDPTSPPQQESGANHFNKNLLHCRMSNGSGFSLGQPSSTILRTNLQQTPDCSPSPLQQPNAITPESVIFSTTNIKMKVEPTPERAIVNKFAKSSGKFPRTSEGLKELLTVFPKATQRKFSGVQPTSLTTKTPFDPCANDSLCLFSGDGSSESKPRSQSQNRVNDVSVVSVATQSQKSFKNGKTTKEKQNRRDSSQSTKQTSKVALFKPQRHAFAASALPYSHPHPGLSIQHQITNCKSVGSFHKNVDNKPKHVLCEKAIGHNVNITLVPMSSVRWSGSIGSLYKKRDDKLDKSLRPIMTSTEQQARTAVSSK